ARGALSLPASEMVEILVYLSGHHLFGEQARLSLAGFDQAAMKEVAADPTAPVPVLEYLAAPQNVRPATLPLLIENPALPQQSLIELAQGKSQEVFAVLLASERVRRNRQVLDALLANHELEARFQVQVTESLAKVSAEPGAADSATADEDILAIDEDVAKYLDEHQAEIAAEQAKSFELTDLTEDEKKELHTHAQPKEAVDTKRMSPLQRISRMTVGERVQLAMKGSREERYILIRDGSKVVSAAVLESPKVTDQEMETFASMKNVQESVLRGIAGKRKFMKLYPVVRALTSNPRCPLDVALPLMKNLLVVDLRNLSMNKNVADTLRKVALKLWREKSSTK
ncbi:MAG TPA: hypothetical protein VG897_15010, partial [Terriglobales bacterium]|nr:hypothetical protein [Terriglobales bacterium]